MLKISKDESKDGVVALKLEGALRSAWVAELRGTCDALLEQERRIALDLRGVTYADRAGAELLESLRGDPRVAIKTASAFVDELLKGGAA